MDVVPSHAQTKTNLHKPKQSTFIFPHRIPSASLEIARLVLVLNASGAKSASWIESILEACREISDVASVSRLKEIETALATLSLQDLQAVREWLDDLIEDQLEVSDEFKTKIHRAQEEIADGIYSRMRRPEF